MTGVLHYPDISSWDQGINFASSYIVCAKATQGTGYFDPYYESWKTAAASERVYFTAYHFLMQGRAAQQADYCMSKVGAGTPLMLDIETTTGSRPTLADVEQFIDEYRRQGGNHLYLSYLPHWYWQQMGSPSLSGLKDRGQHLVTSNYQSYSDNGPGWSGYGGLDVTVWQYSSTVNYGGIGNVDFNAFKGSNSGDLQQTLREFDTLVKTGVLA